jgi:transcriptional regulator with XRE-family HTH domain
MAYPTGAPDRARKMERTSMSSGRGRPQGRRRQGGGTTDQRPGSGAGRADRDSADQGRRPRREQDWENRFSELRRALNYTTTQVAMLVGVSRDAVLKWDSGNIKDPGRSDPAARDRLLQILGLARTPWYFWIIEGDGGLAEALRHVDADAVLAAKAELNAGRAEADAHGSSAPRPDRWAEVTASLDEAERALLATVGREVDGDALDRGLEAMVVGLSEIRDKPTTNDLRWFAEVWIAACAKDVPDAFARLDPALRAIVQRRGAGNGGAR